MSKLGPALVMAFLLVAGCTGDDRQPPTSTATAGPGRPGTPAEAEAAVTPAGIHEHLDALARIAENNGGTRAAGTEGYEDSVAYVSDRLHEAGYDVTLQRFTIPAFEQDGPSTLAAQGAGRFVDGKDFKAMLYSEAGDVTAALSVATFDPAAVDRDGLGCKDLSGFPEGSVVLLRPGPCFFRDQVTKAAAAGAVAVILSFPEYSRRSGVLRPTLISPDGIDIPVLAATDGVGLKLHAAGDGTTVHVVTDVSSSRAEVANVIAEGTVGEGDEVIMVGGHLDSVVDGPGINDNGSGVATILEVAEEFAAAPLENRLRFGFWAGEELGLLGSGHYVESLDDVDDIIAYLNFDMLASPNYIHYIYEDQGPEGGEAITAAFEAHFERAGEPFEPIGLEGRSDHGPFIQAGVPVGGLFSGADEVKEPAQVDVFGGEVGRRADPCYHLACDDRDNVDDASLEIMAAAVADVLFRLASSPEPLR